MMSLSCVKENGLSSSDLHACSFDSFSIDSDKVEERYDDFLMAVEKDLQSEFEEESYGALDYVIMDIDINQLIKERDDGKLSDIANALQSAHCMSYLLSYRLGGYFFYYSSAWKR